VGKRDLKELDSIYFAALELPLAERPVYLAQACQGDLSLRARVEQMLAVTVEADAFVAEKPEGGDAQTVRKPWQTLKDSLAGKTGESVGQTLGRYKLLEKIGEGGCGVVYVAEQTEPVRRRVALKVIKLGMDTKQVVARFEAERQALAMMDHPNIAKVLDGGATENGRLFFVMELVRGTRITDYCDQASLTTTKRLDLFVQVCQAIQHAHQKGIIHRDIKPSNILVTLHDGVPVPKVIDFGIAKATEGRLTDATVYTQLHQFIGTPAYMSPEQAEMSGLDIDTRSDIYSLGVLLYELLAGCTPFDAKELMASGIDLMRKTIREKEPLRPSTRVATLQVKDLTTAAASRAVEAPELISLLRGDLDWIVMKCLEKDRTRRYETAYGLAMDLKRHLTNEPVVARPPSRLYTFQKSFKRNRLTYTATMAVAAALLLGSIVSAWQALRATQAKREALAAQAQALQAQAGEAKQKAAAEQDLYDSLLREARATRLVRGLGYRDHVFGLLGHAGALAVPRRNLADLRDEAVACLGDFVALTPKTFQNFPTNIESAGLSPSGNLAAFGLADGSVQLTDLSSGQELARLPGTNGVFHRLCFDSNGSQLFGVCWPGPADPARYSSHLQGRRLYSWACLVDGKWQQTRNHPSPGADGLFDNGTNVLAVVVNTLHAADPQDLSSQRFRLLDVASETFVDGFDLTNSVARGFDLSHAETPDAQFIAVATSGGRNPNCVLNLYNWRTGQRIKTLELSALGALNLSADGKYLSCLLQGAGGGTIYTLPDLERIGQFKEHFESGTAFVAFWRDMALLPIYQQNRVRIWNLARGEDTVRLDEPDWTAPVAFSATGSFFLTRGARHARIYPLNTPEKLELPSHAAAVPSIDFSPDGTRLASVDKNRVVRVCDSTTGRILWQADDLHGPGQSVCFSPDGNRLATGDFDTDLVEIRDARNGRHLLGLGTNAPGRTWTVQFSPDGRYLAKAGAAEVFGGGIRIYEFGKEETGASDDGRLNATLVKESPLSGSNLLFARDGKSLEFRVWGPMSLSVWDFNGSPKPSDLKIVPPGDVELVSFSPEGHLVTMDHSARVVTLELPSGKEIASFQVRKPKPGFTACVRLSPDGSWLAVTSESRCGVDIWDFRTGKRLYSFPEEPGTVYWMAWSPDSRRLAVARDTGNVAIWNLDTINQILAQLGLRS
jgi:serine/threonine protein kinase/WD40 repeat protein